MAVFFLDCFAFKEIPKDNRLVSAAADQQGTTRAVACFVYE